MKRKLTCTYSPNSASDYGPGESAGSPTKRRHIDMSPPSISATLEASEGSPPQGPSWEDVRTGQAPVLSSSMSSPTASIPPPPSRGHTKKLSIHGKKPPSRSNTENTNNNLAEETNIYTETRMLQDQTRRLLYIGDASTLSILQLIRIIVESTAGPEMGSPFIDDPKRHRIMENIIDFPPDTRVPTLLPDKETADYLIESYFTNTCGMIEVFDKITFLRSVDSCYRDPPSSSKFFLCHFFLVQALGLLLAAPIPGTPQAALVERQLSAKPDRAELFFRTARTMCDPGAGFEDADFWSVQALSLMTLYMLIVSKRNTAYAYLGMAVRSAYALGLHREETMRDVIFTEAQMTERRNLWKTLFILDRFLAATLGRPTAISEDDSSMKIFSEDVAINTIIRSAPGIDHVHARGIDSCVDTCRIIGETLRVFSSRKISTTKVQEIIDNMPVGWDQDLQNALQRRRYSNASSVKNDSHGIAALHVSLMSLHSLILLTRQLFVMHNWMLVEQRSGKKKHPPIHESPMARFSEACVLASYQTITLVTQARQEQYLPKRNPFIIYFIFAASLVICMNQFSSLYFTTSYESTITEAIDFIKYCSDIDPQADRVLEIITKFAEVVKKWTREHTYSAPRLSPDLSFLFTYSSSTPRRLSEPILPGGGPLVASPAAHTGLPRSAMATSDPGLLTPPTIPKMALSDMLAPVPPNMSAADTRMNGMTPPMGSHPSSISILNNHHSQHHHTRQSMSVLESPFPREMEFDFDNLWSNWINHAPAHMMAPTAISTIPPQFSPVVAPGLSVSPHTSEPVLGPFGGGYSMQESSRQLNNVIHGNIPLFHSTGFSGA
ncbi:fungal-specific transcription factor domain-containing protein [Podospora fimiseda]|uniref:Fungal-specific transcription factor domain-containing protein n=1 Tax=Podospora fimiseda TaxID=252190 RepID=A0AAN7GZ65_9PEZI|nr:fungal-specific transcription factor domain-containing protein [Podospora fimiseda]